MYTPKLMPRSSHYGSSYLTFDSRKLNRTVTCYSQLEYVNALYLEFNSKIKCYCEQPLTIEGMYKGKKLKTTFDSWYEDIYGQEGFQEVKESKTLLQGSRGYENAQKQIYLQSEWCLDHGKSYSVQTEKELMMGSYFFNNLKSLYSLAYSFDEKGESEILNNIMEYISIQPRTIKEIMNYINISQQKVFELISWLMYCGKCKADLSSRLVDFKTIVTKGCIEFK